MDAKTRKRLNKIILTAILLFVTAIFLEDNLNDTAIFIIYLVIYFLISNDIIQKAFQNILVGEVFDENFLMLIASVGAFFIGEYHEGIAVILLYQIGELFEGIAVKRSKKSINNLLDLQSNAVHMIEGNTVVDVEPENVQIGTSISVMQGERVPLDSKLISSAATVDMSALTGESVPVTIKKDENIPSGAVNLGDKLTLETVSKYEDSTITKMMNLVEEATSKKATSEQFITKFAKYYTPGVVLFAVLVAVVPLFFTGFDTWQTWLYRALTFLVISCPCALVISVPLSFFAGIGGLAKKGILVKGNEYLEKLTKVGAVVFDKTGTLTTGKFEVTNVLTKNIDKKELLQLVASIEQYSTHPIAKSIVKANNLTTLEVNDIEEISGYGMKALYSGKEVLIGNEKLMKAKNIEVPTIDEVGTIIYAAVNNEYQGAIIVSDPIKENSGEALSNLHQINIKSYMVTGDIDKVAKKVSDKLGLDGYSSQMLPTDKVDRVEEIMKEEAPENTIFAGDGLNDAPVIARADIGFAMGGVGSDIAIEAADVVIMDDEPKKIVESIKSAKRIMNIVKQNITFALVVKFSFLLLAAVGLTTMEWAIFADVGVTVIAILNAMRALRI